MSRTKDLTNQIKELHEKQTEEMRSLEEQAWELVTIQLTNATKRTLF